MQSGRIHIMFSKMGYLVIKKTLESKDVKLDKYRIYNAEQFKKEIEELDLWKNNCTIVSINITNYFPSCKISFIKQALEYFARELDDMSKARIRKGFEIMTKGMIMTLLTFQNKYYKYGKEEDFTDPGTSIGGTESSFSTDTSVEYIMIKLRRQFLDCVYSKVYRDDKILVFDKLMQIQQLIQWLTNFQLAVNKLFKSDNLQFTMEAWIPDHIKENDETTTISTTTTPITQDPIKTVQFLETYEEYMQTWKKNIDKKKPASLATPPITDRDKKIKINNTKFMSFLDLQMAWNNAGRLQFQAYRKPNQVVKYISIDSYYALPQLRNVSRSELERLTKLTTINKVTRHMKPKKIYPVHVKKLKEARVWDQRMDKWTFDTILSNMNSPDRKQQQIETQED